MGLPGCRSWPALPPAPPPLQVAGSGRCPYLASGTQAAATTRDMILASPIDIEELAKLGEAP